MVLDLNRFRRAIATERGVFPPSAFVRCYQWEEEAASSPTSRCQTDISRTIQPFVRFKLRPGGSRQQPVTSMIRHLMKNPKTLYDANACFVCNADHLYCSRENPRLCRSGCQSLIFSGVCSSPFERASLTSVQRHSLAPGPVAKRPP